MLREMRNLFCTLLSAVLGLVKFTVGVILLVAAFCAGQTPD